MNTRSTLIIAGIALLLIIVTSIVALSSFLSPSKKDTSRSDPFSALLPFSKTSSKEGDDLKPAGQPRQGTSSGTLSLRSLNGIIQVRDFTKDKDASMTLEEDGWYVTYPNTKGLSYAELWYEIDYTLPDQRLSVTIYREPIGEVRAKVASDVVERLGISTQELCTLDSLVFAPRWVNSFYADKNLGFPGCPDSVKLSGD